MTRALDLAERAAAAGDVPVGALVVEASGEVVGEVLEQECAEVVRRFFATHRA
jgi:tRNA(Arg) A34 adenosine deaminase TadA